MSIPIAVLIKSFFGIYAITPFETDLLDRLSEILLAQNKEILAFQRAHFTTVRRLIRHLDVPNAYGYTFFYTLRFGKDVSAERQTKRFASNQVEENLAVARVIFDGGQIDVTFGLAGNSILAKYRSPQNVYYPPGKYQIESLAVLLKA